MKPTSCFVAEETVDRRMNQPSLPDAPCITPRCFTPRALLVSLLLTIWAPSALAGKGRPTLGVVIVVDQLRSADLDRLGPLFREGDFGGLNARGAARFDALYQYAATETGPGHATLMTCANPNVHGIAANEWMAKGVRTYAVDDPASAVFGRTDGQGRGPRFLAAGTLGDALRIESGGVSRVVAISVKDRSAILSGGPGANVSLWYDADLGRFTSSSAFGKALPAWAVAPAEELPKRSIAGGEWSKLPLPDGAKAFAWALSIGEGPGRAELRSFGANFPHDLKAAGAEAKKAYRASPQSMEDTFSLALLAVEHERLGQDSAPDLLVISISATDYAGHVFGPTSREVSDLLRRLDVQLRAFLSALDRRVGVGRFVVAVASDHGGSPPPEQIAVLGIPAGRVREEDLLKRARDGMSKAVPAGDKRVQAFIWPHLFLSLEDLTPEQRASALSATRAQLLSLPGVAEVYEPDAQTADPLARLFAQSSFPGRTGQLLVRLAPRYQLLEAAYTAGVSHGSPYQYDRRVPVLVVGPGVRGGRYASPIDVRDVAPTVAFLLSVPPPDACEGRPVEAVGAK